MADWDALSRQIAAAERGNRPPAASAWTDQAAARLEHAGAWGAFLSDLIRNVRHTLRSVRLEPGFWAVTVLILGLGIGATTAIFSIVDGVLLKPLPYAHPEQLVYFGGGSFPMPRFQDFQDNAASYSNLTGVWERDMDWTGGERPLQLDGALTLPGYLNLFGARAALGRVLGADDFTGTPHRGCSPMRRGSACSAGTAA